MSYTQYHIPVLVVVPDCTEISQPDELERFIPYHETHRKFPAQEYLRKIRLERLGQEQPQTVELYINRDVKKLSGAKARSSQPPIKLYKKTFRQRLHEALDFFFCLHPEQRRINQRLNDYVKRPSKRKSNSHFLVE